MAKVIILCGKIASGKSYYANELRSQTNAIVLSVDELMLKLSDTCLGLRHDDIAIRCENYFYELAEQLIASGHNVIIDFGYWSMNERESAKAYFHERGIEVELHYVKISEEKRYRQLEIRNEKLRSMNSEKGRVYIINEELRHRLDTKFEEPSSQEYDKLITE